MADDALPPLDRGAGTSDDLVIGAVDALERIIPTVNQLVAAMLDLQDRAADLEAETPEKAPSIAPAPWVKWLRVAYKIESSILENWESIPGAAQELHALHAAWCAAYKPNGLPRPGHAAAAWHDSLDRALPRIRAYTAAVDKRGGTPQIPPLPAPDVSDGD